MTWFINFCAPFLPNDPTINTNRYLQVTTFLFLTVLYACTHIYYKICGSSLVAPQPQTSKLQQLESESKNSSDEGSSQFNDGPSKMMSAKMEGLPNQSCAELKKSGWEQSTRHRSMSEGDFMESVTFQQLQQYFPIVYGHFSVAVGLSVMYTPYAEQTIAMCLFVVFSVMMMVFNSCRHNKTTMALWTVMASLVMFVLVCGLLEVGQSNWDRINNTCFALEYSTIY